MKICWDNLEGMKLTVNGIFVKNGRDSYIEMESCIRCGEPYLALKCRPSPHCSRSCFLRDRRHTEEAKKNMSKAHSGEKNLWYRHGAWLKNLPSYDTYANRLWCDKVDFEIVDESKIIKVKCVSCDKYFVPKLTTVIHRIRYLEGKESCESRFYCSDKCRGLCPVFGQHKFPKGFESNFEYTRYEYETWRLEVLDRADNKCEYCGKTATEVHHIKPKHTEPFFALDPDYGIACCDGCHYKYGHQDECSTGVISNKICL